MADSVLLIGMMGAGKTTIGELLARALGLPFHDSDAEIYAKTGMTVPEIFASKGEPAFRAEERNVLAAALSGKPRSVIAVAGGAVFDVSSRRRMRAGGVIIWLRAKPKTLADRVGSGEGRPLLEHDPAGTLARLDAMRRPVYRSLADYAVDTDAKDPNLVVERVRRVVRSHEELRR